MEFLQWFIAHWDMIVAVLVGGLTLLIAVLKFIPGDQGESALQLFSDFLRGKSSVKMVRVEKKPKLPKQ
jgi:hypothetical protein